MWTQGRDEVCEEVPAIHPGHHQVEHDHLRRPLTGFLQDLRPISGRVDLVAFCLERDGYQGTKERLVICH